MNTIFTLDTDYLKPDITIETVFVCSRNNSKLFLVYNYQGLHFRVFEKISDILHFINGDFMPELAFDKEEELDNFLKNFDIK